MLSTPAPLPEETTASQRLEQSVDHLRGAMRGRDSWVRHVETRSGRYLAGAAGGGIPTVATAGAAVSGVADLPPALQAAAWAGVGVFLGIPTVVCSISGVLKKVKGPGASIDVHAAELQPILDALLPTSSQHVSPFSWRETVAVAKCLEKTAEEYPDRFRKDAVEVVERLCKLATHRAEAAKVTPEAMEHALNVGRVMAAVIARECGDPTAYLTGMAAAETLPSYLRRDLQPLLDRFDQPLPERRL